MIPFNEYCARKAINREIKELYVNLPNVGVNPEHYLNFLIKQPTLWDKEPMQVLEYFKKLPIEEQGSWGAALGGAAQGVGKWWSGGSKELKQAKDIQDMIIQAKKASPQQLQQMGLTQQDLAPGGSLDQLRAKAAQAGKEAEQGRPSNFLQGLFGGAKKGYGDYKTAQVLDKVQRLLGRGAYSTDAQAQQQQGQQAQQQQQGEQPAQAPQQSQGLAQHLNALKNGLQQLSGQVDNALKQLPQGA